MLPIDTNISQRDDASSTMQNSYCRLNILEIMIPSHYPFSSAYFMQYPRGENEECIFTPAEIAQNENCENKINYGMIFVSFAKIGIKFFNFSFAFMHVHTHCERNGRMNADMFVNA